MTNGAERRMTADEREALEEVRRLEPLFHAGPAGAERATFDALTAPDFREVGASGRSYAREEVWDALAERGGREPGDETWETSEWRCRQVGTDTFLVTYLLRRADRVSRRLTVWERVFPGWRAVYHQGTLVTDPPPPSGPGEVGVPLATLAAEAQRVWRDPSGEVAVVFLPGRAVAGWLAVAVDGTEQLCEGAVVPDTGSRAIERAIAEARERRALAAREGRVPGA